MRSIHTGQCPWPLTGECTCSLPLPPEYRTSPAWVGEEAYRKGWAPPRPGSVTPRSCCRTWPGDEHWHTCPLWEPRLTVEELRMLRQTILKGVESQ